MVGKKLVEPTWIDLSHLMVDKMQVYPGDPAFSIKNIAKIDSDGYTNSLVSMNMHLGTHIDAPAHMIVGGKSIYEYEINRFMGMADLVFHNSEDAIIDISILDQLEKNEKHGDFLLIRTDCSHNFGNESYLTDYPVLSIELAEKIVALGYSMIGLDTVSPDKIPYNIHKILLANDVLIIENLTHLDKLPDSSKIELICLPLHIQCDSSPIRVVAKIEE